MNRFAQKLLGNSAKSKAPLRVRPAVEGLEERALMTVSLINGVLTVKGTMLNPLTTVFIQEENTQNVIRVFENGAETHAPIPRENVSRIVSSFTRGFNYTVIGSMDFARTVNLNLSPANSSATFDFSAATIRKDLTIGVQGHFGTQTVNMFFGEIENARVDVDSNLKWGDDRFTAEFGGDILGNARVLMDVIDVPDKLIARGRARIPGGSDHYTIRNAAGVDVHLGQDALLDVLIKGSDGVDNLNFSYSGLLDGSLSATLKGEGGAGDLMNGQTASGISDIVGRQGSLRRGTLVRIQDFNL
jgi:hypothetical protein